MSGKLFEFYGTGVPLGIGMGGEGGRGCKGCIWEVISDR